MPPTSSTINMVPGILNISARLSQIPMTTITNVVLNSVPIMSTTVSPNFPHTTTTTYTSYIDPLMGYSEEEIVKNIVNKNNEQMGVLTSTIDETRSYYALGHDIRHQFATPQSVSLQPTSLQQTTNNGSSHLQSCISNYDYTNYI